jgi:hypothetical protein
MDPASDPGRVGGGEGGIAAAAAIVEKRIRESTDRDKIDGAMRERERGGEGERERSRASGARVVRE